MSVKITDSQLNPFPGLRPFEFHENHLFFGREGQSEKLLKKLRRKRFVAVVGTSGSGKSSLVRAGLLPLLYGGFMSKAGPRWRLAVMRPGTDPIHNLAAALNSPNVFEPSLHEQEPDEFEARPETAPTEQPTGIDKQAIKIAATETILRRSARGLVDYVRRAQLAEGENLLVVVDQFEELFRFKEKTEFAHSSDEAAAFVKLLLEGIGEKETPIYLVLTMRSDFLGDCAQFRDLPEAINESQYLIPRMTRDQQRDAITCPAAVRGARMTPRLVQRLLNDIGDNPDQLPILQHALMRMWDQREREHAGGSDGDIDLSHYDEIGGMEGALSKHADEAYNELPDERGKEIAKKLFKALTETVLENREIRRPAELSEMCDIAGAQPHEVIPVIEIFRRPGRSFLMPPAKVELNADTLIDISHESLIKGWTQLKTWVEEEAQSAQMYRRLAEDALLHKADKVSLWDFPGLKFALEWRETQKPTREWAKRYHPAFDEALAFLQASEKHRAQEALDEENRKREEMEREKRILEGEKDVAEARRLQAESDKARAEHEKRSAEAEQRRAEVERKLAEDAHLAAQREAAFNLTLAEEQKQLVEVEHRRAEEQSQAARRLRFAVGALIIMFALAVVTAAYAVRKKSEAESQKTKAESATAEAVEQKKVAEQLKAEAQSQRAVAEMQSAVALEQKRDADIQREKAKEQETIAKERSVELASALKREETAKRQKEIEAAHAREQTVIATRAKDDADLAREEAVKMAEIANKRADAEVRARLAIEKDQKNREALLLLQMNQLDDAGKKFRDEVLPAYKGDPDGESWVEYNLGAVYRGQGKYTDAEKSYESALAKQIGSHGENHGATLASRDRLAHLYQEEGKFDKAEDHYKHLFNALCDSRVAKDKLYLCDSSSNNNLLYLTNTREDLAKLFLARAKDKAAKVSQQKDEVTRLNALRAAREKSTDALSVTLISKQESPHEVQQQAAQSAVPVTKKEISVGQICRNPVGDVEKACGEYGRLKKERDKSYTDAEGLYLKVLSDRETTQPLYSPNLVNGYSGLALVYREQPGKNSDADSLNKLATSIRDLGITQPSGFEALSIEKRMGLADAYASADRPGPAQTLYKAILAAKLKPGAGNPKSLMDLELKLAHLYEKQKKYAAAEKFYEDALSEAKNAGDDAIWSDKTFGRTLWAEVGDFYHQQGEIGKAENFYALDLTKQREEAAKQPTARNKYFLSTTLTRLASRLEAQSKLKEATEASAESLKLIREGRAQDDPLQVMYVMNLAEFYRKQERLSEAEQLLLQARQLWSAVQKTQQSRSPFDYGYYLKVDGGFSSRIYPSVYATILTDLASVVSGQKRVDEADKLYTEAITHMMSKEKELTSYSDRVPSSFDFRTRYARQDFYTTYASVLRGYAEHLRKTKRTEKAAEQEARAEQLEKLAKEQPDAEAEEDYDVKF